MYWQGRKRFKSLLKHQTPNVATQCAPFELFFGRRPRLPGMEPGPTDTRKTVRLRGDLIWKMAEEARHRMELVDRDQNIVSPGTRV